MRKGYTRDDSVFNSTYCCSRQSKISSQCLCEEKPRLYWPTLAGVPYNPWTPNSHLVSPPKSQHRLPQVALVPRPLGNGSNGLVRLHKTVKFSMGRDKDKVPLFNFMSLGIKYSEISPYRQVVMDAIDPCSSSVPVSESFSYLSLPYCHENIHSSCVLSLGNCDTEAPVIGLLYTGHGWQTSCLYIAMYTESSAWIPSHVSVEAEELFFRDVNVGHL